MHSVAVITPPASTLVTLDEVKLHLRVDHTTDDVRLQAMLWAAQNEYAGPDGWTGRSFSLQTLELRIDGGFPSCEDIVLPCPPLVLDGSHALTVKYTDAESAEQTVAPTVYVISGSSPNVAQPAPAPARLSLAYGESWPVPRYFRDAVRIRYFAGYPIADASALQASEGLKAAIKLHVQMIYDNEDEAKFRKTIDNLLATYRVW